MTLAATPAASEVINRLFEPHFQDRRYYRVTSEQIPAENLTPLGEAVNFTVPKFAAPNAVKIGEMVLMLKVRTLFNA